MLWRLQENAGTYAWTEVLLLSTRMDTTADVKVAGDVVHVLLWYYDTADADNWTMQFSTTSADGASDNINFAPMPARYVRLDTTQWNNSLLRNWLKEFKVYG